MATAFSDTPCAERIVEVNEGLVLNVDTLRRIFLHEEIKEKKVCVVSIAGAFRQGKSFLLNFFIRYLSVTCNGRKNLKKWLTPEDGPISGFTWKGGADTVTIGIVVWSEIFLSQLSTGDEVAIVLMDTQGSFDNETTLKNCVSVFALSTLISSVQIYNLKENIKSYDLSHLQFFLSYGQLLKQSGDRFPFQNLLFLIRDWTTPEQYPFGMVGGEMLLSKVLDVEDNNVNQEIISLRKGIRELFKQIDCYLLPHPGLQATKFQFNGELEDIDEEFKNYVEILATTLLSPKNLVPKVINGEFVKVKHLVDLFENYYQQFKDQSMPEVKSLFETTANAQHLMALEEAEVVYDKLMAFAKSEDLDAIEESLLLQEHEHSKSTAVEYFLKRKIIGDQEMKMSNKNKLEDILDIKFTVYDNLNQLKLQKEKEARMQEQFEEQRAKLYNLEEKLSEEEVLRQYMMEEYLRSITVQQERISDLESQLDAEKEMIKNMDGAQKEAIEEQRAKISQLVKILDEERAKREHLEEMSRRSSIPIHAGGSFNPLDAVSRSDEPAAKFVKGVVSVGYGLASMADGVFSTVVGIFKK